jgi:hypothetical protein
LTLFTESAYAIKLPNNIASPAALIATIGQRIVNGFSNCCLGRLALNFCRRVIVDLYGGNGLVRWIVEVGIVAFTCDGRSVEHYLTLRIAPYAKLLPELIFCMG